MKLIVVIEASQKKFDEISDALDEPYHPYSVVAVCKNAVIELGCIETSIDEFENLPAQVMLVRYSGSEALARILGDEREEDIFFLSSNKLSKYYVENLKDVCLNTIRCFSKKETV